MDPQPIDDDWEFTEVDGLIVCVPRAQALSERAQLLEIEPNYYQPWALENFINHVHLDCQKSRKDLRTALREADVLAEALRRVFPKRRFVINNRLGGDTVSFYQAVPGAPTVDQEPLEPLHDTMFCSHCKKHQPFRIQTPSDPEFPELTWVNCAECGREQWLEARSRLSLVGPSTE
jgi:hypothetical protein